MKIQILSNQLINQIAAGEVVERPASVVKELIENSIDAKGRHINVRIEEGGLKRIEVEDDGEGMTGEEIPVAFLRHATSKIREEEDLYHLTTLGFRGEALPSIASVSKSQIYSAKSGQMGSFVYFEGGEIIEKGSYPLSSGTRIVVSDLFYNTPVRRKFMKSTTAEFHKIHELMIKQALSQCAISFTFQHNGKVYFKTPGSGRLNETVAAIWGKNFLDCFIPVFWQGEKIRLTGLISRPDYKRSNRQRQIFFVNGRIVQNPILARAVDEGYRGLLVSKEYPAVILFLEIAQEDIDCNVHPQKMQVRFQDEGQVFQIVKKTLREHLGELNHQINFKEVAEGNQNNLNYFYTNENESIGSKPNDLMYRFSALGLGDKAFKEKESDSKSFGLKTREQQLPDFYIKEEPLKFQIIGQIFRGYILMEIQGKLWIVDQHAAHERINYNLILKKIRENQPLTQMLIIPQVLEITPKEMDLFQEKKELLQRLGFIWDLLGEHALVLRGVPETCADAWENAPDTIESLYEITSASSLEKMAARLACKKSVKDKQNLSMEEMKKVITELLATEDFRHCPHGRPTFVEITHEDLERKFKRI